MSSKVKVKVGLLEVEFEGSEDFIQNGLLTFVESLSGMTTMLQVNTQDNQTIMSSQESETRSESRPVQSGSIQGTTNTIAAKLKVSSGPELVVAAAAHLTFVKAQDKFHRKDLLEQCQSAANYYKQSYSGSFSKNLNNLVKAGQLAEQSKDVYAIPASQRQRMEMILVE